MMLGDLRKVVRGNLLWEQVFFNHIKSSHQEHFYRLNQELTESI